MHCTGNIYNTGNLLCKEAMQELFDLVLSTFSFMYWNTLSLTIDTCGAVRAYPQQHILQLETEAGLFLVTFSVWGTVDEETYCASWVGYLVCYVIQFVVAYFYGYSVVVVVVIIGCCCSPLLQFIVAIRCCNQLS